jgi:hypothetical protein
MFLGTAGQLMQPGDVLSVCHSSADEGLQALCDTTHGVTNFNGDDRVVVVFDTDADGTLDARTDEVMDAFGELAVRPANTPWADKTYRRCNLTPYSGTGAFDVATYFGAPLAKDTFDGMGVAPTATTCSP